MPTLYTSLIARRNPKLRTFAPPRQRPSIAPAFAAKSLPMLKAAVADEHATQFAEIMELPQAVKSVAIIGAGLAGLSAAYELRKRRYSVTVFEAADRPGGRTVTVDGIVKRHQMDGGAELIGSKRLRPGAEEKLLAEMNKAFSFISSHAKKIIDPYAPWTDPHAADLDRD